VLKGLRERRVDVPVLVITAARYGERPHQGLDARRRRLPGEPFDLDELSARVRALVRRAAGRAEPVIERGPLVIIRHTRSDLASGSSRSRRAEYARLAALAERPGLVLSRAAARRKALRLE